MPEPLSAQEIEAKRKGKLDGEKLELLKDYDDSSDEEDLDYKKVPREKIKEAKASLTIFKMMNAPRIKSLQAKLEDELNEKEREELKWMIEKKERIKEELEAARDLLSDNPSYVMEIEGRKAIYHHLLEYKRRKYEAFGEVPLKIEGSSIYNFMLVAAMKDMGVITEAQANKWKEDQGTIASLQELGDNSQMFIEMMELNDAQFFTEENKFRILRQFLRQTNREAVDRPLSYAVSDFAHALGSTKRSISEADLKSVVRNFSAQLPAVRRPTLRRTRVNPDIESVNDFYAEELLRYRSLTRSSREVVGEGFEVTQTLVFNAEEDLVSQKKQTVSRDKREDKSKDRFAHRGTVEEEVLNLGNYKNILERLNSIGLGDKTTAITLREVFKCGAKNAFEELKVNDKKLSELLSPEKKQIIVDTVELLFGTEGFRSPSAIVETNMMLDLIIEHPDEWNFSKAFTGKIIPDTAIENGGALSYTMKATGGHTGGVASGRKLSQNLDDVLNEPSLRTHKYGGPSKTKPSDFAEYKKRKEEVAQSWVARCTPNDGSSLESKIQKSSDKWYSR